MHVSVLIDVNAAMLNGHDFLSTNLVTFLVMELTGPQFYIGQILFCRYGNPSFFTAVFNTFTPANKLSWMSSLQMAKLALGKRSQSKDMP